MKTNVDKYVKRHDPNTLLPMCRVGATILCTHAAANPKDDLVNDDIVDDLNTAAKVLKRLAVILERTLVLHLRCANDRNGNPRRCFVVLNPSGVVAAVDEGYKGHGALTQAFGELEGARLIAAIVGQFDTTPKEYRNLIKNFPVKK